MVTALSSFANTARVSTQTGGISMNRLSVLGDISHPARSRTEHLVSLAIRGLPQLLLGDTAVHTGRGILTSSGVKIRIEGEDARYAAIVALGASCLDENTQRSVLGGKTAAAYALKIADLAEWTNEPGAVALAAWAAAEVANMDATRLLERLATLLKAGQPVETVVCAWALTAAIAQIRHACAREICDVAARRLKAAQGFTGLFPHMLPAGAAGSFRSHVGCFADQVYPIQALSRLASATGDQAALAAADRCAAHICELQGKAGQWWWHYDVRHGSVVEGYPVYSVHQHAMAPMALFDLWEAGGADHSDAIMRGLSWLDQHPEAHANLISEQHNVIWRKIGRREPAKMARKISAVTTSLAPGFKLPGLDRIFPPERIDYECRPYELGWLLYAWLFRGFDAKLNSMWSNRNGPG
jgi:hypothetical protein